jgi:hypothetical protein
MEPSFTLSIARTHLALVLSSSSNPASWQEARELAREELANPGPRMHVGLVHGALTRVAVRQGELAEAEREARKASELLAPFPAFRHLVRPLSTVLRAQGRIAEAREVAAASVAEWEALESTGAASVGVYLELAEICLAQGDTQAGESAVRKAVQCLRTRAEDIPDPAARERFLRQVPENARAQELAEARGLT